MQRRRDRSPHRRLLLACLTSLLTGIVLGMSSAASAVSAPQIGPMPSLTSSTAITYTWSGQGDDATTTCELTKGDVVVAAGTPCTSPWSTTRAPA